MSMRSVLIASTAVMCLIAPALAQTVAPASPTPMTAPAPASPTPMTMPAPVADMFYTEAWVPTHWRSSEAIGQPVYNRAGERVGEVDELLLDSSGRVLAAVIGVGGFLGMGERKVAISYRSFEMTREGNGRARLVADLNVANLRNAPEYKPMDAAKRS